jgi:ATP-dependent DNA helicase HFM1/MER3
MGTFRQQPPTSPHLLSPFQSTCSCRSCVSSGPGDLTIIMGDRIFEQLDRLQAGARRETAPRQSNYHSSTEYSAFEGYPGDHGNQYESRASYSQRYDDYADEPMRLDAFDERLLQQADQDTRQAQAAMGHTRLSFAPHQSRGTVPRLDPSQFAHEPGLSRPLISSEEDQAMLSSPAFKASQRRPSAYELPHSSQRPGRSLQATQMPLSSTYQPQSVAQLEEEEHYLQQDHPTAREEFRPSYGASQPVSRSKHREIGPPVVQDIQLVSTHDLPDRFRAIFPFPLFNAVQSKCFDTIYKSSDNFVLSAPTGSGKTAILELAICRLIARFADGSYKIVYQAPTKSLCAERARDWQRKFGPLGLACAELTGDTENAQLKSVQHAQIIITTPEKFDSMTRKWKDQQKLMQMVKLFLIDEVHILKEQRGATLEAVVSRVKSVGSDVRFVALSATVPNFDDIASWLGLNPMNQDKPAKRERFTEDFRPVRLQKHVCGYQTNTSNDFAFEKMLKNKLPDVITKYSQRKPIMVFCFTRAACVDTAKLLANWWATKGPKERHWTAPRSRITVGDADLRGELFDGLADVSSC